MKDPNATIHTPVLLQQTIQLWQPQKGGFYLDATVGTGGHLEKLLEKDPEVQCVGVDLDPQAIQSASKRLERFKNRVILLQENYKNLSKIVSQSMFQKFHGILVDLGLSSLQLEDPLRGFSFQKRGPLDMRMNPTSGPSAQEILSSLTLPQLIQILREYGEEKNAFSIARRIHQIVQKHPIQDTLTLAQSISGFFPRRSSIHPATKTFQALRIATNHELDNLDLFLSEVPSYLIPKGRLCILSYHSLEDRKVKVAYKNWAQGCHCPNSFPQCVCGQSPLFKILTKKPLVPTYDEIQSNPRARSAKLRVAEKW